MDESSGLLTEQATFWPDYQNKRQLIGHSLSSGGCWGAFIGSMVFLGTANPVAASLSALASATFTSTLAYHSNGVAKPYIIKEEEKASPFARIYCGLPAATCLCAERVFKVPRHVVLCSEAFHENLESNRFSSSYCGCCPLSMV